MGVLVSRPVRCDLCKGDIVPVGECFDPMCQSPYGDRLELVYVVRRPWYRRSRPEVGQSIDAHPECITKLFTTTIDPKGRA